MAAKPGFFVELKRRNVLRAGVLYAGAVWALSQGIAQLGPAFGAPNWVTRWFVIAGVIGFPFWLAFAWFYEFTPDGLKRESEIDPADSVAHRTNRKLDFAIIGVLAIAVVLLLTDRFVLHHGVNAQAPATAAARAQRNAASATPDKSIAVLPLVNESIEKDQQYFSDGLSESLINALAQFQGLKVIGRNSSFQFRDSKDDSKTIGHKLGVAHLLEGSVRRAGGVVRISAQLIKASDGSTLWSQQYDRPYKDLFALQDDITRAVSNALKTRLLAGNPGKQSDRPASGNVAAYEAVLQGSFHLDQRNEAGTRKAIDYFVQAVQLDPDYAYAWARLAAARSNLPQISTPTPAERTQLAADARVAVTNALRLDGALAEAYLAQGRVALVFDHDARAAFVSTQRAVDLAPQNAQAVTRLSSFQGYQGQLTAAVATAQRAIELDPLAAPAYYNAGLFFSALKRYPEAEASFRKAIELRPQGAQFHAYLAIAQALQGHAAEALATAQQEPDPFWRTYALALAQRANGDHAASDAALHELIAKDADDGGSQIAIVYAQRRQPDEMFRWLEHARETGDGGYIEMYLSPFLAAYRDDPRFAAFCKRVGLPTPDEVKASAGG